MNRELAIAFYSLRVSERTAVLQDLDITFGQSWGESNLDYAGRILKMICNDGKVRELENAMRRFQ